MVGRSKTAKDTEVVKPRSKEEEDKIIADELEKAHAALLLNKETANKLSIEWRAYLLRMSYMVILLCLYLAQQPMANCIKEVKMVNKVKVNSMERPYTLLQAMILAVADSTVEFMGMICAGSLAWLLSGPPSDGDFTSSSYHLATSMLPLMITQYFSNKEIGCVQEELLQALDLNVERTPRSFPIVVIFHVVISIVLWFMQDQRRKQDKGIEKVLRLKQDLLDSKKSSKKKK